MNQLTKVFEGQSVRILGDKETPLFVLADVCKVLEIGNPSDVKKRLEGGVVSIEVILDVMDREQQVTAINEDGLYDVILDSRKPQAKRFRKWITGDVLPSLRKTGTYEMPKPQLPQQVVETMPKLFRGVADLIDWKEVAVAALDEVQMDIHELKNGLTLTHGQELAIQEAKRRRVRDMFDRYGDDHPFLDTKAKFHSRCGSDLKKAFNVPRYGEILRKDFEEALQYVQAWRPPFQ
ncbi:BRO family protein [Exiguobacterium sp. AB2]|uniref:BRO family protein n=1 Tax=Exiguobacterium sp. AB2 TaxID=1484479 RepID=UPI0004A97C9E|nr:BRO family protein [Exiguobacterium sp. AB2]KDN58482.1 hypothetical protein DI14_04940 [Exiguobacterium sp. AB2]